MILVSPVSCWQTWFSNHSHQTSAPPQSCFTFRSCLYVPCHCWLSHLSLSLYYFFLSKNEISTIPFHLCLIWNFTLHLSTIKINKYQWDISSIVVTQGAPICLQLKYNTETWLILSNNLNVFVERGSFVPKQVSCRPHQIDGSFAGFRSIFSHRLPAHQVWAHKKVRKQSKRQGEKSEGKALISQSTAARSSPFLHTHKLPSVIITGGWWLTLSNWFYVIRAHSDRPTGGSRP